MTNLPVMKIVPYPLNTLQLLKLVVYSLLIFNFFLYIRDDFVTSSHTLRSGSTFLEITRSFATTIDESAWITLLLLFELETYLLSDDPLSRSKALLMQVIRLICYVSLAHTLYAWFGNLMELYASVPIE